jgi:N-acetylglutamate synthase-like GNAT family acetyltransferase
MSEPISLRRAGSTDAVAVRELTRAAYAKWVPLLGREPFPMTIDYERAVSEHLIDLFEEAGALLALIEMIPKGDHLLIENIAVRPDQQGKGLGQRVLCHADDVARGLGFTKIELYTNAAFASNVDFYAKRGFEEYRRESTVRFGTTVFMRKGLEGPE